MTRVLAGEGLGEAALPPPVAKAVAAQPKPSPAPTVAYNPAGYVPGGSSPAKAKAIEKLAIEQPGPRPLQVPAALATEVGATPPPAPLKPAPPLPSPVPVTRTFSPAAPYGTPSSAGPFAGAGLVVGSTEASWQAAIANARARGGPLDWVAFPPGVPLEVIAQARAAGLRIIAWQPPETSGLSDPAQLVRDYGAAGFIGQAESAFQWGQALAAAAGAGVPSAVITNNWSPGGYGDFPPGLVALPELYVNEGQVANFNALTNFAAAGASATVPLLGIYSDANGAPGVYRGLAGLGLPGVSGFVGQDLPTAAGLGALASAAAKPGQPQTPPPGPPPRVPGQRSYCFQWGGRYWGKQYPGAGPFENWLRSTGEDPALWARNHPQAAQCIGIPQPAGPSFCFEWGGERWGKSYPGWAAFESFLRRSGDDPATWIEQHPDAARCIGASKPAPAPTPPPAPGAGSWEAKTLAALKAPQSDTNLIALSLWAQSEGMQPWANNPLAATDTLPGSGPYPPAPAVQVYPLIEQAAKLYAFKFETAIYAAIGRALRSDAGYEAIWRAVNGSPWCGGCQSGRYPVALYDLVFGKVAPPGSPPPSPGGGPAGGGGIVSLRAPGVQAAWAALVNLAAAGIPRQRSAVSALSASLVRVFR